MSEIVPRDDTLRTNKIPIIQTNTIRPSSSDGKQYVKLNVGGCLYHTTVQTLVGVTHVQGSMLHGMFSGRVDVLTDEEGFVLIDRDGKHFGTILNYLRDGTFRMPHSKQEIHELLKEAQFYLLEDMATKCSEALELREVPDIGDLLPKFRLPIITSPVAEKKFLSIKTPVVKFAYNRSNNKYSYTEKSDNTLLCNIELFDKLSSQFHDRLFFVKDLSGRNEICCWTFYGGGKKISEISCTSIVYATERKQTKIEFPEAKIYEETLNCTLYKTNEESEPSVSYCGPVAWHDDSAPM